MTAAADANEPPSRYDRTMNRRASLCALLVLFPLLSACSSSGSRTAATTVACQSRFWNGTVGTCLPQGWHAVDPVLLQENGLPPEVVAAFQADAEASGVYPTVTVTRQVMRTSMTAEQFSTASIQAVSVLPQYKKLDQKTVSVDGREVAVHVYSAQLREDRPVQRYYQMSTVSGRSGFTFTGALPLSVDTQLEQKVLLILQNASFMEPVVAPAAAAE